RNNQSTSQETSPTFIVGPPTSSFPFSISNNLQTSSSINPSISKGFIVDFTFPTPVTQNSPVLFNATVSGNSGNLDFQWRLADGTYVAGNTNPMSYTFSTPGNYTLALRVYDYGSGASAYASHSVIVLSSPTSVTFSVPTGGLFGYPGILTVGNPATFTASLLSGGRPPYSFAWTFGDGGTGTGVQASHTYTTAGSYTVVLRLTEANGAVATASVYVIV